MTIDSIKSSLQDHFQTRFHKKGQVFYAPGRVNIIGEHTDYNHGFVMPMAINKGTYIAIAKREDNQLNIFSQNLSEAVSIENINSFNALTEENRWANYAAGIIYFLIQHCALDGHAGADIYIYSDLPMGAGLSSSASLTITVGYAYQAIYNLSCPKRKLAELAQKVEHQFAGTLCGIMDQMVCALAKESHALCLDCDTLTSEQVPCEFENLSFVICDSSVKHSLADSAYNDRRASCELAAHICGEKTLREVAYDKLISCREQMPKESFFCAKHVITENQRVLEAKRAMRAQNWHAFGALMFESHQSLQHDFRVSCDELDYLVELSKHFDGVYGARMTGGGFGGSIVALVEDHRIDEYQEYIQSHYSHQFSLSPKLYISRACQGVRSLM